MLTDDEVYAYFAERSWRIARMHAASLAFETLDVPTLPPLAIFLPSAEATEALEAHTRALDTYTARFDALDAAFVAEAEALATLLSTRHDTTDWAQLYIAAYDQWRMQHAAQRARLDAADARYAAAEAKRQAERALREGSRP